MEVISFENQNVLYDGFQLLPWSYAFVKADAYRVENVENKQVEKCELLL